MIFASAISLYAQDNLEKGMDAVNRGDYLGGLNLLKGVSKDSYDANLYYGIALFNTGSVKDAEKFLKDAIKKDDERPEAYSALGQLYTSQKNYSEAAAQFENSRKFLPLNKKKDDLDKSEIETIIKVMSAEAENLLLTVRLTRLLLRLPLLKLMMIRIQRYMLA